MNHINENTTSKLLKGEAPNISPEDLRLFFQYSTQGKEVVSRNEAINLLAEARAFLVHPAEDRPSDKDSRSYESFQYDCRMIQREITRNILYSITKYLITGGLLLLISSAYFFYTKVDVPLRVLWENRKILSLIGRQNGWEINPDCLGYHTPWEIELRKGIKDGRK